MDWDKNRNASPDGEAQLLTRRILSEAWSVCQEKRLAWTGRNPSAQKAEGWAPGRLGQIGRVAHDQPKQILSDRIGIFDHPPFARGRRPGSG
jgi:hypothetical protein